MAQMKAAFMKVEKAEADAQQGSRLQRLLRKGKDLVAQTKVKVVEVAELAAVKVDAVKVKTVESVTAAKAATLATVTSAKQRITEKASETVQKAKALKAAAAASYEKLRADGVISWSADIIATCKKAMHSRMAALFSDAKRVSANSLESAKAVAKNRHVQATAAGVASGAVAGGASGMAAGGALGAVVGLVPALFTFGLSIPIGAAIGIGAGLAAGTTVGAVGGGAAAYGVYAKKDEIREFKNGTMTKVSSGVDLMKLKASESADYIKGKASSARMKASESANYIAQQASAARCRLTKSE
eukprot:TRINITY_DN107553_c0_g1_i1.p1 TRINITY_DN107553_c0_g1~~TRINITY_DN107553_c0_g1_i1.p1  ORF type:complete len:319 (-),score=84.70 TRINITY_DN107553_c0_g1_i1:296-1195(-)